MNFSRTVMYQASTLPSIVMIPREYPWNRLFGFDETILSRVITVDRGRIRQLAGPSPLAPPKGARRALSNGALAVSKLEPDGAQQAKECQQRHSKRTLSGDHW